MKRLLMPLLLIAGSLPAETADPYRTFADIEGRQIRAALVRASDSEVWIRRDDGQTFQIALVRFSEPDQKHIQEWRLLEAIRAPRAIEFSSRRFTDQRNTRSSTGVVSTTERCGYTVTLSNRTQHDIEDLEIEYRYFIWQGNFGAVGQNRRLRHEEGRARIARLAARGEAHFQTDTAVLQSTRIRADWTCSDSTSAQRRSQDDLRGIWVRVYRKGALISEFASPAKLMETETWPMQRPRVTEGAGLRAHPGTESGQIASN
jgi:hypothetical protein